MALITCKDCQREFSTDAKRCPSCGAKKAKQPKEPSALIAGIKWFFLFAFINGFFQLLTINVFHAENYIMVATLAAIGLTFYIRYLYKKKEERQRQDTPSIPPTTSLSSKKMNPILKGFLFFMAACFILSTAAHLAQNTVPESQQPPAKNASSQQRSVTKQTSYKGPVTGKNAFMCANYNDVLKFMSYLSEGNQTDAMEMIKSPSVFGEQEGCQMLTAGQPIRIVRHDDAIARVEFGSMFG